MKYLSLFFVSVILIYFHTASGKDRIAHDLKSPDKNTRILIYKDDSGKMAYKLYFHGKEILGPSKLGLVINGIDISEDPQMLSSGKKSFSGKIAWPLGESAEIDNRYNELDLKFRKENLEYRLLVRVFNGSAAFRYLVPRSAGAADLSIQEEKTSFNLMNPYRIYQYHHESIFTPVYIDSLATRCDLPATLTDNRYFLSIGEADNMSYTKAELNRGDKSNELRISFVHDKSVIAGKDFASPWRTISVSSSAIGLHQFSQLYLKLADPAAGTDPAKVVPGKLIRAQLNTQSGIDCIDLAEKLNFKYIMFDAGWYGPERAPTSDPRKYISAIDLPAVIGYGKQKGIGVILYVNYLGLQNYLDEILPLYKQWGVAGIKFGFIDGFTQKGLSWLSTAIRKVDSAGLVLNIHDNYKPTGLSRTYPYLLTQEGIRGDENSPDAFHNTTLPFTRFLAGAADFTFCFPNSKNTFSKNIKVSKAQQLALTVVNFSPLQAIFWYGQPKDYTNFEEIEFFKYVPTVWDESHYLAGEIGENVSVARRKGDTWFLGNVAGFSDWTHSLNLDFLSKGKRYKATIYEDGEGESIVKKVIEVKRGDRLPLTIKAKGGQAIIMEPSH